MILYEKANMSNYSIFRLPVQTKPQSHLQDFVKAMRGLSGIRHQQKPRMTEIIV